MFDMMKKAQEMKRQMEEIKARLDTIEVTGKSSDSKVLVRMTGNRNVKGIEIADEALMNQKSTLEKHLEQAVSDAIEKATAVNEAEMKAAAGSMIPGMGGLFK